MFRHNFSFIKIDKNHVFIKIKNQGGTRGIITGNGYDESNSNPAYILHHANDTGKGTNSTSLSLAMSK